jgi:hypothetical protein
MAAFLVAGCSWQPAPSTTYNRKHETGIGGTHGAAPSPPFSMSPLLSSRTTCLEEPTEIRGLPRRFCPWSFHFLSESESSRTVRAFFFFSLATLKRSKQKIGLAHPKQHNWQHGLHPDAAISSDRNATRFSEFCRHRCIWQTKRISLVTPRRTEN